MRLVETILHPKGKYRISEATEDKPLPKGAIAEITFDEIQVGDKPNGNGRVYPWKTLRAANESLLGSLKGETLPSFDGHPKDTSEMLLSRIPAVLKDFRVDEDTGTIRDATFYLANNQQGRDALPLLQLGMVIGTSSRGNGSLKEGVFEGRHGKISGHIVQEDLILEGYDLVLKPSVVTARASGLREDQQEGISMTVTDKSLKDLKDLAELKSLVPDIYRKLMAEALNACESKLQEKIDVFESEIRSDIKDEIEKPLHEKIAKLEKELTESRKQVAESKQAAQKLTESATANERVLQTQIADLNKTLSESKERHSADLAKVNEAVLSMQLRENMALAKAYVISATESYAEMDKNTCDVLRASVLGTDPSKGGVKVSEALTKAYAHVKAPVSVQEATDRLNMAMVMATSLGVSSEKGHRENSTKINESSAAEDRLTSLTYGGRGR